MGSYNGNLLISLIHNRDRPSSGAEPSSSLLGRNNVRLCQSNLDHLSTIDLKVESTAASA